MSDSFQDTRDGKEHRCGRIGCGEVSWPGSKTGCCLYHASENGQDDRTALLVWEEARKRVSMRNPYFQFWHFPHDPTGSYFQEQSFELPVGALDEEVSEISFQGAMFDGSVEFFHARFLGPVTFESTSFQLEAGFGGASFEGYALFRNARFVGSGNFMDAVFRDLADFRNVWFFGNAYLLGTLFEESALFSSSTFQGEAHFDGTKFENQAVFRESAFQNRVDFSRCVFQGKTDFQKARFWSNATFRFCRVEQEIAFSLGVRRTERSFLLPEQGESAYRLAKNVALLRGNYPDVSGYLYAERCASWHRKQKEVQWRFWRKGFWGRKNGLLIWVEWIFINRLLGYFERPARVVGTMLGVVVLFSLACLLISGFLPSSQSELSDCGVTGCLLKNVLYVVSMGLVTPCVEEFMREWFALELRVMSLLAVVFLITITRRYLR